MRAIHKFGKIQIEGVDIGRRRLLLGVTVPVFSHRLANEQADPIKCEVVRNDTEVKATYPTNSLKKLEQLRDEQDGRKERLEIERRGIAMNIEKLSQRIDMLAEEAEIAIKKANEIRWTPAWLNYTHLTLFLMLCLGFIVCKNRWWKPQGIRRAPKWPTINIVGRNNPAFMLD